MSTERNKPHAQMLRYPVMSLLTTFCSNLLSENLCDLGLAVPILSITGIWAVEPGRVEGFIGILLLTVNDNSYSSWREPSWTTRFEYQTRFIELLPRQAESPDCTVQPPRHLCKTESPDPEVPASFGSVDAWVKRAVELMAETFLWSLPGLARKEKCPSIIPNCTF